MRLPPGSVVRAAPVAVPLASRGELLLAVALLAALATCAARFARDAHEGAGASVPPRAPLVLAAPAN